MVELNKTGEKRALSGWPMLIFWWAMIVFALQASTHMVGAGDTWVAMACGRHFLNHGVDTVEPFSANSHKPGPTPQEVKTWPKWAQWVTEKVGLDSVKFWHPTGWVDQNWLTHVLFYWLTHLSPIADAETFDKPIVGQKISYNSLVYWKCALYIVTIIVVYYTGRILGANPALSAAFACFALFISRTFLDIRPAGFSNMLTAILLFIFILTVYRNYLFIWLIVPITALWCNLHGGYVYVFVVLVPFIVLHLLALLPKRTAMCIYYILGWLFFFVLAVTFRSHEYLEGIAKPESAGLFYFILILAVVSIVLASLKDIKAGLFHMYHITGTLIVFIATSARFYPQGIEMLMRQQLTRDYVNDSRRAFFVAFIGFIIIAVLLTAFKGRLKTIGFKAWWHSVAAAVIAFVVMILANPFRLTNLTHTFVITVSEQAKLWKTVNEWHPAFEWNNPVGDEIPFFYMYVAAWVLLALWVVCLLLKPQISVKQTKAKTAAVPDTGQYKWPMIDLPLMVIASLTVFMAIGSRRFIPIAAIAACPIMAMFLDSSIKMIAVLTARKIGENTIMQVPRVLQYLFAGAAFVAVAFLTVWWGHWYRIVYLSPWPDSCYLSSVFMRMTASYAKPFKACQFIRDNHLRGTVFNYWTEGGFIAYGQIPDPNGKTPLQLYMDGRAQAAYNTETYQRWMRIMSGGDPVRLAQSAGRALAASDYQAVGNWLERQFQQENVSVVLMPSSQLDTEFIRGLDTNPNWRAVYMDEEQRIYIDINSPQGKEIYMGMFSGQTKYPDEITKQYTMGYNLLRMQNEENAGKGGELLAQAFLLQPSQLLAVELIRAAGYYPKFRDNVAGIFSRYFDDFVEKKQTYLKQNGYREKIIAAMLAGDYLANINSGNPELAGKYNSYVREFSGEQQQINQNTRW